MKIERRRWPARVRGCCPQCPAKTRWFNVAVITRLGVETPEEFCASWIEIHRQVAHPLDD